ncbi:MAG: hypothetical protein H6828_12880 [Planctomycetes bacterium]|nr:hypothetical protein [Planctomycetota bacterium]
MRSLALALALSALACGCAAPSVDVMPRFGAVDPSGNFGIRDTGGVGTLNTADIEQAGFTKDDSVLGLRADLDAGMPRVTLALQQSNHDGSGTLSASLTDSNGNTINAGAPVDSKLDLGLYQGIVTWDVLPTEVWELGLGLGLVGVDVDASVTDTSPGGDTLDVNELVPIPVLAVRGGVVLGDFEITALLDGFRAAVKYDEVTFVDLDLFARYRLLGGEDRLRLSAGLGYRYTRLDVESNEDGEEIALDLGFSGPYLMLQASF